MKSYIWLGPNRFVPPIGYMETGKKTPDMPDHTARYFASLGWLKMKEPKRKDDGKSINVTLKETIKVGDK